MARQVSRSSSTLIRSVSCTPFGTVDTVQSRVSAWLLWRRVSPASPASSARSTHRAPPPADGRRCCGCGGRPSLRPGSPVGHHHRAQVATTPRRSVGGLPYGEPANSRAMTARLSGRRHQSAEHRTPNAVSNGERRVLAGSPPPRSRSRQRPRSTASGRFVYRKLHRGMNTLRSSCGLARTALRAHSVTANQQTTRRHSGRSPPTDQMVWHRGAVSTQPAARGDLPAICRGASALLPSPPPPWLPAWLPAWLSWVSLTIQ
jgi:hypothetical protein